MKKTFLMLIVSFCLSNFANSQEDAEGCKDHPLLTRMPNYVIENCKQNFNEIDLPVSDQKKEHVEGNITMLHYVFNAESGKNMPSLLQISKNYENAIIAKGGKKVFYNSMEIGGEVINAVFNASVPGKNIWVAIGDAYEPQTQGEIGSYSVWIIEVEEMAQEVSASEMLNALNTKGSVSLYINFETGKANIQPESQKLVDQVAAMLKANPALKIGIEGHTDNVGDATSNQTLSENRAKAVMNALVQTGIDITRLQSKGWGQSKPIADNKTEQGKAKNRRVEIIKL